MCFFFIMLFAGPRAAIVFWWLIQPNRWDNAFTLVIWPILGFIFLPWTTLMFVAVAPFGNVDGADWAWLALAFLGDWFTSLGGGFFNRNRIPGYARY
jgi:hypothetical protein